MWQDNWRLVDGEFRQGGQGTVRKVVSQNSDDIGCLKELHLDHLGSTERRFRMQQEANALIALDGAGVPRILETNVHLWQEKRVPLYIVMEWIEGPTLAESVPNLGVNEALAMTTVILRTIAGCHRLDIRHRDLKPDNVILRQQDVSDPVLVDFGMSWSKPLAQEDAFQTPAGQELGNRFLRLPEFAPGRDHHDLRSDLSLVVGLLFFVLCGRAPRILHDSAGQMPHERHVEDFVPAILADSRWPAIRRLFQVGFQPILDARFQSSEEDSYELRK